jgi:hypothetical protein
LGKKAQTTLKSKLVAAFHPLFCGLKSQNVASEGNSNRKAFPVFWMGFDLKGNTTQLGAIKNNSSRIERILMILLSN